MVGAGVIFTLKAPFPRLEKTIRLERVRPLYTLRGSFISNAEACWTTRSPSPRPSPRGEGEATPDPRTLSGHTIRRPTGNDPPSPWGEGRGEGELAAHGPTGSSGRMRVRCSALSRFSSMALVTDTMNCTTEQLRALQGRAFALKAKAL